MADPNDPPVCEACDVKNQRIALLEDALQDCAQKVIELAARLLALEQSLGKS